MRNEFSLAHLTVLGCAPPEMTYVAGRAGYDYVSFRPIYMGLPNEPNYDLAKNPEMLRQTKKALAYTGVRLYDIELARIFDHVKPKNYEPAMEVAAELGGKAVICSVWTPDKNLQAEAYGEICDLAKPYGLTVDLEFVSFASLTTLKDALRLVRAINRENAGIMIDTLHFNRSRINLEELDDVPRKYFHFAHLCDAPQEIPDTLEGLIHTGRDERLYLGEGGIDIASIVNRMPQMVYSLEIPHVARVKEMGYAEHAARCLQAARAYLEAHPRKDREDAPMPVLSAR